MKKRRRGIYACIFFDAWFGSSARRELSPAGRAAYWELLLLQGYYGQQGHDGIPSGVVDTDEKIASATGFTLQEWVDVRDDVLKRFGRTRSKGLRNARMAKEVDFIAQRVRAAEARHAKSRAEGWS